MRFTLRNDVADLNTLCEHVKAFARAHQLSDKLTFELNLALDELFTNAVSYGFGSERCSHCIHMELTHEPGRVTIRYADDGVPFDPSTAPPPDLQAPLASRRVGGLGIHLVQSVMDEVHYAREGDSNVITLVKHLPQSEHKQ